jgi:hypothetical protein
VHLTGLVLVGADDDYRLAQELRVFGSPFACATGVAGRGEPLGTDVLDVLLALSDVDDLPVFDGGDDLRQSIQDAASVT